MAKWKYEGHDSFARPMRGSIDAASMEDAAGQLRDRGVFVRKLEPEEPTYSPPPATPTPTAPQVVAAPVAPPERAKKATPAIPVGGDDSALESDLDRHSAKVARVFDWLRAKKKTRPVSKEEEKGITDGLQKATALAVCRALGL